MADDNGKKYTISFINGNPGLVVKADNMVELENAILKVLPIFKKFKDSIKESSPSAEPKLVPVNETLTAKCSVHGAQMTNGTSKTKLDEFGKPKSYWYHREGSQMCFGKGWAK